MVNNKMSEALALAGVIDPASIAVGTASSAWVPMADFERLLAVIQTGVLGAAATLDGKLQQATDAAGTGAKDITGKAITQIVKATGDNVQAMINVRAEELDVNNGFTHVALVLTVGTANSIAGATLFGGIAKENPASTYNAATVAEIV